MIYYAVIFKNNDAPNERNLLITLITAITPIILYPFSIRRITIAGIRTVSGITLY